MSPASIFILGMRVDMVQIPDVITIMEDWITSKSYGHDIVISNANDALLCRQNTRVREAVNTSSLSVADGISLVLLARRRGFPLKKRVYGPDLMMDFLYKNQKRGFKHFFYGSRPETLDQLKKNLIKAFPDLDICGVFSPPFGTMTPQEDEEVVATINESQADVVWVGLGCPKQQLWMHAHKDRLKIPVMVGVGAAFDFLAGVKPQAPRWLRENGFEWLFRLLSEPRRLWKRYLFNGPLFMYYVFMECLSAIFTKRGKKTHV